MLESVTPLSLSPPPAPLASHSGPVGDVAADLQGFRVLRAQYPHVHRQQRGVLVTGATASPAAPIQRARLTRMVIVSGCFRPRTCTLTGSSAVGVPCLAKRPGSSAQPVGGEAGEDGPVACPPSCLSCQTVHSAWVGDRRAARMAGSSPARAPMMTAAASPPAQAWGGMTTASPWPRA